MSEIIWRIQSVVSSLESCCIRISVKDISGVKKRESGHSRAGGSKRRSSADDYPPNDLSVETKAKDENL